MPQLSSSHCENCQNPTPSDILQKSANELGHALCRSCLANLKMKIENSTWNAISLCLSLKKRGLAAVMETGNLQEQELVLPGETIGISVLHDTARHAIDERKAGYRSFRKGLLTVYVPEALVTADTGGTTDYITSFLATAHQKQGL